MSREITRAQHQWKEMLTHSFQPRQWFLDGDRPRIKRPLLFTREGLGMWIYQQTAPGIWTVGFISKDGEFHAESDFDTSTDDAGFSGADAAARRCHYLNGGSLNDRPQKIAGRKLEPELESIEA